MYVYLVIWLSYSNYLPSLSPFPPFLLLLGRRTHSSGVKPISSTVRSSFLRESATALLKRQGTVFGDFVLTEFSDQFLAEHVLFLAVVDIPRHLPVGNPNYTNKFYISHAPNCSTT